MLATISEFVRYAFDMILAAAGFIIRKAGEYSRIAMEWFKALPLAEELIIINGIPAICAVILPAARFYIFESWFEVNNPLAVWMIGIGFLMFGTIFFRERVWVLPARVGVNVYYLGWAIYMSASGSLSKADSFTVTGFYAFNYVVPVIYSALALMSFLTRR
jgi:hypothetical protein